MKTQRVHADPVLLQEIYIDAVNNTIDMRVSDEELARRRLGWKPREPKVTQVGLLHLSLLEGDFESCCVKGNPLEVLQACRGCVTRCDHGRPHVNFTSAAFNGIGEQSVNRDVLAIGQRETKDRTRGVLMKWWTD